MLQLTFEFHQRLAEFAASRQYAVEHRCAEFAYAVVAVLPHGAAYGADADSWLVDNDAGNGIVPPYGFWPSSFRSNPNEQRVSTCRPASTSKKLCTHATGGIVDSSRIDTT